MNTASHILMGRFLCPEPRCKELIRAIKAAEKDYTVLGCPISNSYGCATVSGTGAALSSGIAEAERMMYREKKLAKAAYLKALQEFAEHAKQTSAKP